MTSFEKISGSFENGTVSSLSADLEAELLDWNEHPQFKGVFLKHTIKGVDTGGSISCHFVKLNPGSTIDTHIHSGKLEVHEVIEGKGLCRIGDRMIEYKAGSIALIPADTSHKVIAGEEGLFLLAKFSPALL